MPKKAILLSAVAVGMVPQCLISAAQAQTDPAARQEEATQGVEAQGEIVITARKRNERLLDVPVAVSALGEEQLERYSVNSLSAIGQQVPSLIIAESQNQVGGSINLRGIGAGVSNPSTEQSVTLNLDGIAVSYGNAVRLGQLDVQRVEVLKGPQALFYGKNSPGGILSLISKDPGDEFEAQVRAGYEFAAQQKYIEGIVSGPLTDGVGARLVGYYSKEDGWFRNIGVAVPGRTPGPAKDSPNAEDIFLRGTLVLGAPSSRFNVKAKLNYGERSRDGIGPGSFAQIRFCPLGVSQVSGRAEDCGLDRNFADVRVRPEVTALHPALRDGVPFTKSKQLLGSLTGSYDMDEGMTLTSVTGYYRITEKSLDSFTFVTVPQVAATNDVQIKSVSQELRLASDWSGPINFLVGGFIQDSEFTIAQVVPIDFGGVCPSATCFLTPFTDYDQDTLAYSLFAQVRYNFSDQLELAAGARQSWEKKSLSGIVNNTPFTILNPKKKYHDFSPEVTLTYKPNRDLTVYAAYREGFTSGGFNTTPTAIRSPAFPTTPLRDISFDQMTARGGELGVKGYLLSRQMLFDIVGYHYKYKGLQLTSFDTTQTAQLTQNAGGAKIRGIEFNTVVRPNAAPGLELRASANYNKANYTDFIGACYPGQSIAAGCNLRFNATANPPAFTSQDQTGQQIARAPKWALTGGFTYDHQINDSLGGSISFDVAYTSSYMTQIEAQPEARQPGYWLLNGNLTIYGGEDRAWQVALIGRNLTNKIVAISGGSVAFVGLRSGTNNPTPADLYGSVNLPRSILLQVTLKNTLLGGN